ncbi:hypothetical protein GCM10023321_63850 [Pseudonocardia eucalypti]|uniref:Uncharacterized protein n=1 Tax=Pseudonocardia eucalypti TaxID=648755 RepID=A0ABP9QXU9_9PSEU
MLNTVRPINASNGLSPSITVLRSTHSNAPDTACEIQPGSSGPAGAVPGGGELGGGACTGGVADGAGGVGAEGGGAGP